MSIFSRIKKRFEKASNRIDKNNFQSTYTGASDLLEIQYGHKRSKITGESIDAQDSPIPWFTYSAISYLNQLDFSEYKMLEWGSGNSTKYFSARVKELYSIEHDQEWFKKISELKLKNHKVELATEDYAKKPFTFNSLFDLILIDGIKRGQCANSATELLKEGGIIILDNSDRHPDIAQLLRAENFLEVDFHGFGPINDYTWTTSIFFHRKADLKPISIQPVVPIGGGY